MKKIDNGNAEKIGKPIIEKIIKAHEQANFSYLTKQFPEWAKGYFV